MTDRKWVPAEYIDEVSPPGRTSPDAWIVALPDGSPALAGGDPFDEAQPGRRLKEGHTVLFDWTEDLCLRELTFRWECGRWQWTLDGDEPAVPRGGHLIVAEVGNWESMMPSLDGFAEAYAENLDPAAEEITVLFCAWSTNSVPFVFRSGSFLPIAAVGAIN